MVALLASAVTAFSQKAVNYSAPRPLPANCEDDPLHPIAGREYIYSATGVPSGGDFRFWATKDQNFISTTGGVTTFNYEDPDKVLNTGTADQLISVTDNYNKDGEKDNSVSIIWSSGILGNTTYLTNPTFVAVHYKDPTGCSDNFKVWEIKPINGFTVDVLAIDPVDPTIAPDYTVVPEQCADEIRGASYNAGTMNYDYGTNYVYFEFVAANFSEYWVPTFEIDASTLNGVQTVTYEYTYDLPSTWDDNTVWTLLESGETKIETDETNTENGVSVFVRVTIEHNNYENLNGQTLTMVLDGQNKEGLWDVVNDGVSPNCIDPGDSDQNDKAYTTIKPRPEIEDTTDVTNSSDPQTLVPGDEQN